ncbi:MAG: hypothetical protein AB1716_03655 [Planctomycetota bacterium]
MPVPAWAAQITTAYHPNLEPEAHFASRTYTCSACHSKFESGMASNPELYIHRNIGLEHGLNDRCFNCHHVQNRNALVDDWGNEVPYDQPQLLCRKCHGPVYRDWLHGAHGRTIGFWDAARGPRRRLQCDFCHDPHRPPFPPMPPAPGPHTLRMGKQEFPASRYEGHHPLRIYRQPGMNEDVLRLEHPLPQPSKEQP